MDVIPYGLFTPDDLPRDGTNDGIHTGAWMRVSRLLTVMFFSFILGCASSVPPEIPRYGPDRPQKRHAECRSIADDIECLEQDLIELLGYPDEESTMLAETAVTGAKSLAGQYEVRFSGKFHNFMILLGLRNRGLCCHWTRDLLDILRPLELQHYRLFWAVSEYATNQEHSSIVVTAAEQPFDSGIVLDAWRNGGDLYWTEVTADTYVWHPHPEYDDAATIICEMDQKN